MKILTDRSAVRNASTTMPKKIKSNDAKTAGSAQNADRGSGFDQIMISRSETEKVSDDQFVNMLKKQLSSEVKAGASSYALDDLQRQIALGQYDINASDIARRLICE